MSYSFEGCGGVLWFEGGLNFSWGAVTRALE